MAPSLLQALDDPQLLGAGFTPHPRQRELAETIQAHPITMACCGRRFGKSRLAVAAALHNLLLVPELDRLVSAGEPRYALVVASSREQARLNLDHARSLVQASPVLRAELVRETANELIFQGGRVFAAMPCSAQSTRGRAASVVVLDELAHYFDLDEGGPQVAARIWASLTPSVAQFAPLGRVVAISTPLAPDGTFSELYAKAQGGELGPTAAAFHAPTSANPMIEQGYLAAQEAALGTDDFRREFGAEFLAGGSSFMEASRIRECVGDWKEALPGDGRGWCLAFDPAFSRDPAAAAVVGRRADDPARLLVAQTRRWLPPKSRRAVRRSREEESERIETVVEEVASLAAVFGVVRVVVDQHLPGTLTHEFARHGLGVVVRAWSSDSKTHAFQALRALVYTGRIELPDDPQLIAELSRLRSRYRAGSAMVETPRVGDSHCDVAIAVAAGVWELEQFGSMRARSGSPARRPIQGGRSSVAAFLAAGGRTIND